MGKFAEMDREEKYLFASAYFSRFLEFIIGVIGFIFFLIEVSKNPHDSATNLLIVGLIVLSVISLVNSIMCFVALHERSEEGFCSAMFFNGISSFGGLVILFLYAIGIINDSLQTYVFIISMNMGKQIIYSQLKYE